MDELIMIFMTYAPLVFAILTEVGVSGVVFVVFKKAYNFLQAHTSAQDLKLKALTDKLDTVISQNHQLREANVRLMEELTRVRRNRDE